MGLEKGMCLDSSVTTEAKLIMRPSMLQMNAAGEKWTYQLEAHRGHGSRRSVSSAFGSSSHPLLAKSVSTRNTDLCTEISAHLKFRTGTPRGLELQYCS